MGEKGEQNSRKGRAACVGQTVAPPRPDSHLILQTQVALDDSSPSPSCMSGVDSLLGVLIAIAGLCHSVHPGS